jgi:hypothetical protein
MYKVVKKHQKYQSIFDKFKKQDFTLKGLLKIQSQYIDILSNITTQTNPIICDLFSNLIKHVTYNLKYSKKLPYEGDSDSDYIEMRLNGKGEPNKGCIAYLDKVAYVYKFKPAIMDDNTVYLWHGYWEKSDAEKTDNLEAENPVKRLLCSEFISSFKGINLGFHNAWGENIKIIKQKGCVFYLQVFDADNNLCRLNISKCNREIENSKIDVAASGFEEWFEKYKNSEAGKYHLIKYSVLTNKVKLNGCNWINLNNKDDSDLISFLVRKVYPE